MLKFIKNIIQLIVLMVVLSVIVFYMARMAPGDPLISYYGEGVERMSTSDKEKAREELGLNDPLYIQYGKWIENAIEGDFGISFKYKEDVKVIINDVYINTLLLGGIGFLITFITAITLGVFSATKEDSKVDKFICAIGNIINVIPTFWIALIVILIFSVNMKLFPSSGAYSIGNEGDWISRIEHLILPVLVLVIGHIWYYAYIIRNKLVEELREDYVLLCKIKGVSNISIIAKHCLRNSWTTIISLMAVSVPHILGGTYVVEKVFSYPGLGTLCFESAKYHDYNMLMVLTLITGLMVFVANFIANTVNNVIDPRIRHTSSKRNK